MKNAIANQSRICCIHSSDAPQHVGELKAILQRMKLDNRIFDFATIDITDSPLSTSFISEDLQGVIVLLTNGVEHVRKEIEKLLPEKHDIKLIEIIVDNLPYNNAFISFPQDLKPISTCNDMNLVWKGIEENLEVMFPKPPDPVPLEPKYKPDSKKYLMLAAISIAALILSNTIILAVLPHHNNKPYITLNTFIALLPFIIFNFHRKTLESFASMPQEKKNNSGAIDWGQLLKRTGIALAILFGSFYLWEIVYISSGIFLGETPPVLGAFTTILFLFYGSNSDQDNSHQSSTKKILKFVGMTLLFIFLSSIFSMVVFRVFFPNEYINYIIILTVVTTLLVMLIWQRRRRSTPSSQTRRKLYS